MGVLLAITGEFPVEAATHALHKASAVVGRSAPTPDRLHEYSGQGIYLGVMQTKGSSTVFLVHHNELPIVAACYGAVFETEGIAEPSCNTNARAGFENIPAFYEKFGPSFAEHLIGEFCIALWDGRNRALHLIRDHLGTRPLFYARFNGGYVAGNTTHAVVGSDLIQKRLDTGAVSCYFAAKALSAPRTMFKDVLAVRASHVVTIGEFGVKEHDYWGLHTIHTDTKPSKEVLREQLKERIECAVKTRRRRTARCGAIVSGGIDSSTVAALLIRSGLQPPLDAFSVAFTEHRFSDADLQDHLAKAISLNHHRVLLRPETFSENMLEGIRFLDAPINDTAYVGMLTTFKAAAKNGIEVLFEGEGPDEIFPAGNTHGEREVLNHRRFVPRPLRRVIRSYFPTMPLGDHPHHKALRYLGRLSMDETERMLTWRTYFHHSERKRLLTPEFHTNEDPYAIGKRYIHSCRNADHLNKYQYTLIKTFLTDDLLYKNDRMAWGASVLNSTPLIDKRIVESALSIPSHLQIQPPNEYSDGIKLLYKEAVAKWIPQEILTRKKTRGFSQPTPLWYRNELKEFVRDSLFSRAARERGIVDHAYVRGLFDRHVHGKANCDYPLSAILIFELWMQEHFG
ncbi:MAG: hypothetical protein GF344_19220 [Chitinivibrionales bacterium]|nr:hypothetical protein [Chitinivibrionales bacterium]MBD3358755.1 hypothetical protein [Chitinivibrionales bacterium]